MEYWHTCMFFLLKKLADIKKIAVIKNNMKCLCLTPTPHQTNYNPKVKVLIQCQVIEFFHQLVSMSIFLK